MRLYLSAAVAAVLVLSFCPRSLSAEAPPSAVGSMLNLLKSGRVPEERLGTIVKLVCSRGNEHDLRYVFSEVAQPGRWPDSLRLDALGWLIEAGENRSVIPAGDLEGLAGLLRSDDPRVQSAAVELAGLWKTADAVPLLAEVVQSPEQANALRRTALRSLAAIDADQAQAILTTLTEPDQPFDLRVLAVSVMTTLDVDRSARAAAAVMQDAAGRDDPGPIVEAFLDLQNGSGVLAGALKQSALSEDVAKLALRHMYSLGRSDPELSKVLSNIAGISEDPDPPTDAEVQALVQEVLQHGDAKRGEQVFRRSDLSCMKCHAVSKAGGQIGPDLSAVGTTSPVEFLITSVLDPDRAIKEAYTTKIVLTAQGKIFQGIVADRTSEALILRDAAGRLTTIAGDDIEEEIEGKSLMPKGLVKFMTHTELVDLVKFLSMLGKPGEYAVRSTPRMQRWQVLPEVPEALASEIPPLEAFEDLVLEASGWEPVYARVNGDLPLAELEERTGERVIYLRGEISVTQGGGPVGVQLDSPEGIFAWVGNQEVGNQREFAVELEPGIHPVTLRIDLRERTSNVVRLELTRISGSPARFAPVDGQ